MASVTQCDRCGNVVKHEQAVYITVHKQTADDKVGALLREMELCPTCYGKINTFLSLQQ